MTARPPTVIPQPPPSGGEPCGVLVVGHGTRDATGAEETRTVTARLAAMWPAIAVEGAFLELLDPAIDVGLDRLRRRGCRYVVVAPLLLFAAGHARRDVPEAWASTAAALGLRVAQADVLGTHPAVVALAVRRRDEALADRPVVPAADTIDLVVGRGAGDGGAACRLGDFVAAVDRHPGPPRAGRTTMAFVAAARPTMAEAIAGAAAAQPRRVVVRPHLLFSGAVERDVALAVAAARADHPSIEWVLAGRLGADEAIAVAVADRVAAAWPSRRHDASTESP